MMETTGLLAFVLALVASLGLTPVVRRLAVRLGMVDQPGPRKLHLAPVPLLGGLAIYAAALAGLLLFAPSGARAQMAAILSGATLLFVSGVLDDRGWLHHQVKLFVVMPVAALLLLASGIRAGALSILFPSPFSPALDVALTLAWIIGITAAFSILDHMDGLCSGVAAVAATFFLILAAWHGQVLVGTLAAAVLGASLGFLRWNFSPARIFMGDGGAMFLGFILATIGLKLRFLETPQAVSVLVPVLVLGVPIFDTALVTFSRALRGLVPFASPGKDHVAHRLANLGLGQRGAVLALYAAGAILGLLGLLIGRLPVLPAYLLAGLVGLAALGAVAWLERAPFERQEKVHAQAAEA
jgi:UDP-GlcNAc:undecaprenyl-phosphate GlcNAc-1-phosphate transferase